MGVHLCHLRATIYLYLYVSIYLNIGVPSLSSRCTTITSACLLIYPISFYRCPSPVVSMQYCCLNVSVLSYVCVSISTYVCQNAACNVFVFLAISVCHSIFFVCQCSWRICLSYCTVFCLSSVCLACLLFDITPISVCHERLILPISVELKICLFNLLFVLLSLLSCLSRRLWAIILAVFCHLLTNVCLIYLQS
jgi:hypothetical protein